MDDSQSLFTQADAAVNEEIDNPTQEELAETVPGLLSHLSDIASEIVSGMYRHRYVDAFRWCTVRVCGNKCDHVPFISV